MISVMVVREEERQLIINYYDNNHNSQLIAMKVDSEESAVDLAAWNTIWSLHMMCA